MRGASPDSCFVLPSSPSVSPDVLFDWRIRVVVVSVNALPASLFLVGWWAPVFSLVWMRNFACMSPLASWGFFFLAICGSGVYYKLFLCVCFLGCISLVDLYFLCGFRFFDGC